MKTNLLATNSVHLAAFDCQGQQVLEASFSRRQFYEESHPILDDAGFRRAHQIVVLNGTIYDAHGSVSEEFEVRFDSDGGCLGDAVSASTPAQVVDTAPSTDAALD